MKNREKPLADTSQDWKALLEDIRQENDLLKTSLASMMDGNIEPMILKRAEYFQNEFLKKDEIISVLKHELYQQEKGLAESRSTNSVSLPHKQPSGEGKFYKNLVFLKEEFIKLKEDFGQYSSSLE